MLAQSLMRIAPVALGSCCVSRGQPRISICFFDKVPQFQTIYVSYLCLLNEMCRKIVQSNNPNLLSGSVNLLAKALQTTGMNDQYFAIWGEITLLDKCFKSEETFA